ncbi:MAG: hypothetical protein MUP16_07590 [Sedimentisphaerales bacterium]|nr:hypothetical protein [Sedimentisphaerales bacterium]
MVDMVEAMVTELTDISMSGHKKFKSIHLISTAWFVLCIGYILVLALWQAGVRWWVIFSLSGYSILVILLLLSLYLFAIFRGISKAQTIEIEHPLTSADYYRFFYTTAPFLGGLAGCIGMIGEDKAAQFIAGVALGTFGATFLVWVIVDPITGLSETLLLPASRRHRLRRLAQARAERKRKQLESERLLADILLKEEFELNLWQQELKPQAEKLAGLLTGNEADFKQAELEAVDIGLGAWRLGGLSCMKLLRDMAIDISKQRNRNKVFIDYISAWWDGIGTWRDVSFN